MGPWQLSSCPPGGFAPAVRPPGGGRALGQKPCVWSLGLGVFFRVESLGLGFWDLGDGA